MKNPDGKRFKGRCVLITGGGSGIGRGTAHRIAAEAGAVVVADIDENRARGVVAELHEIGASAVAVKCDVTIESDCERAVGIAVGGYGRLDGLLTAAGVHGPGNTVVDTTVEMWDEVINLDLRGAFLASKYAVPAMRESEGGAIVHISSIGGLRGSTHGLPFQTAKGGLINLTRHMAVAHANESIRTNCICPGVIETNLTKEWLGQSEETYRKVCAWHPMNRIGTVEEVAATVAFLLSYEAGFINGAIIPVDGGYLAAGRGNP